MNESAHKKLEVKLLGNQNAKNTLQPQLWGVILAGGDGTRLRSLTELISGDERPKQFCHIFGNESLLERTVKRTEILIHQENILLSLTRTHERFYKSLFKNSNDGKLVIQPANLGTAPAILYSLLRISLSEPEASVAFFPSDHFWSDDLTFMAHVKTAHDRINKQPGKVVLLGIRPDYPETEYGWIEPVSRTTDGVPVQFSQVKKFWEKPSKELALRLKANGCLWNSFVMVGKVTTFLKMIERSIPKLYNEFLSVRGMIGTLYENEYIEAVYKKLTPVNFSHSVLEISTENLLVLTLSDLDWSDLGEPRRVLSVLENIGINIDWKSAEDVLVRQTG